MLFSKNTAFIESDSIHSVESGKIDYEVNLNHNQHGLPNVMESNMSYISSLIDTVSLKISYDLVYDRDLEHNYKYKILADFVVKDANVNDNKDNTLLFFTDELYSCDLISENSDESRVKFKIVELLQKIDFSGIFM